MHNTTLGLLANNVNVKTLAINTSRLFVEQAQLADDYIKNTHFEAVSVDTRIKILPLLLSLFKKESYFIQRFLSTALEEKIKSILEKEDFDIVQLEHLYVCPYIKIIKKHSKAKIVYRAQNVEYMIWERYLKEIRNPFKVFIIQRMLSHMKSFELSVLSKLDGIIVLTKEDETLLKNHAAAVPIKIIPMGFDYSKIDTYNFNRQYESAPVVYHLASMDWLPNVEAVRWFLKEVLPILEKEKNANFKIVLAGRRMPNWVYKYQSKNLSIFDNVTAPLSFQEDKTIMIVPLWSGSGIRAKIIEGMALGKTIIATSIGAQGILYEHNKNILIADTPEDLAYQIMRCLTSPELCRSIGTEARRLSMQHYHYHAIARQMIGFYNDIKN